VAGGPAGAADAEGAPVTIIRRSALEYWGQNPPPDLAYIVSDHRGRRVITWAEVMEARRKRQSERLHWKRHVDQWRAYKLWVAYFDQTLMGGWHAFLEDYRGGGYRIWIDRDCTRMESPLMTLYPLLLPIGSEGEQWQRWKPAFAATFERRRHDRRPLGVAYIWWDGRGTPHLIERMTAGCPLDGREHGEMPEEPRP